jgi:DNA-binding SARP family transcriptional activator
VSLLGGFGLEMGGTVLTDEINRSQKLWNVLSYLIVHRDRSVPQSEFIDVFWPNDDSANPANALKTLLYRIRIMLEPLFGPELRPILSRRGAYAWNGAIACDVDADRFEALCRQAENPALGDEARMALYREAVCLYKGGFLPKLDGQLWVVPLSARYHTQYLAAVKAFALLLETHEDFKEMAALCTRASELDPLDETLHVLILRALIRQGKNAAALAHYEKATDLLYRNLGIHPSEALRALYTEIMRVEKTLETDLGVIQEELQETAGRPGAFVCEYGFFREVYRLEARRAQRSGMSVHIGLITVALPGGGVPPLGVLNITMDQLLEVLVQNLRRGDVISKYSGAQYVVMLPSANFEDSSMVMDRIVNAFYRQYRRNFLKLSCKIRELEAE